MDRLHGGPARLALAPGCSTTKASMHVWKKPKIASTRPQRIAMAPIVGDAEVAKKLELAMNGNRTIASQSIALLDAETLERTTAVQLSSYQVDRSDIGSLSAARRAESQYLVEGEVIRADLAERDNSRRRKPPPESISVHWKVIDVASGTKIGENTIVMDRIKAEKTYPDLEWTGGSHADRVVTAMARQSWGLITPYFEKEEVRLANAWVTPGSTLVRKGNAHAKQGRWDLAENDWQQAVSLHPRSKSAWHNLALAAVAREDFQLARDRMEHAESWLKTAPTEQSLVWIEWQQREFHEAFQLPPPKEGWRYPEPPRAIDTQSVPSTESKDIDKLPWWTAIPFVKPPAGLGSHG